MVREYGSVAVAPHRPRARTARAQGRFAPARGRSCIYAYAMALPASLLAAVEAHSCFTGCYRYDSAVEVCTDPAARVQTTLVASCEDCLTFHIGALSLVLPSGTTGYKLAEEISSHMRTLRGYRWAVSGYRAVGSGLWISAACCTDGLFLVDGSRNRGPSDVEVLVQAFRHGIVQPTDPAMLDPAMYTAQTVYLNLARPLGAVRAKQDILRSPQCSPTPKAGFHRASIVEYLPLAASTSASTSASASATPALAVPTPRTATPKSTPAPPARALRPGDTCPVCHAQVRERPLFSGTFVGCLC